MMQLLKGKHETNLPAMEVFGKRHHKHPLCICCGLNLPSTLIFIVFYPEQHMTDMPNAKLVISQSQTMSWTRSEAHPR